MSKYAVTVKTGRHHGRLVVALAAAFLVLGGTTLADDDGPKVVRVEEDWELVVGDPDPGLSSPQVVTQMAIEGKKGDWSFQFHVNFRIDSPDGGGIELQASQDSTPQVTLPSKTTVALAGRNEVIKWTQYLERKGTEVKFGITKASSQTWGDFGGAEAEITVKAPSQKLDDYSAAYSQQNSGIVFGAPDVASLVLVQTRKVYADNSVKTDVTPRAVYVTR